MRKGMLALFMSSGLCVINPAHELWIEPDTFYLQPGQDAHVNFRVGEDFIGNF